MKSDPPFKLLFIGSLALSGRDRFLPTLEAAMRGGADAFLLREKTLKCRALWELACEARAITRAHGARLLVSDRFDIALAAGADGVHLPESGFNPRDVRLHCEDRLLIGRSVHDALGAQDAEEAGADYMMLGSVFPTPGKEPLARDPSAEIVRTRSIPITAVGGIEAVRVDALVARGFRSFAVIRAIAGSHDPESATRALVRAIAYATEHKELP